MTPKSGLEFRVRGDLPDFRDVEHETGQDRIATDAGGIVQALYRLARTINVNGRFVRIDKPAQLGAVGNVLGHLFLKLLQGIRWRPDFRDKIRAKLPEFFEFVFLKTWSFSLRVQEASGPRNALFASLNNAEGLQTIPVPSLSAQTVNLVVSMFSRQALFTPTGGMMISSFWAVSSMSKSRLSQQSCQNCSSVKPISRSLRTTFVELTCSSVSGKRAICSSCPRLYRTCRSRPSG